MFNREIPAKNIQLKIPDFPIVDTVLQMNSPFGKGKL
jgi:hypothetical protein